MALNPIAAHCNKCKADFTQEPKRSFLGFQKLTCNSCNEKLVYPLTNGYRIIYWVLFAIMALGFVNAFSQGGYAYPGGLGIAIIIALIRDWRIKKRISNQATKSFVDSSKVEDTSNEADAKFYETAWTEMESGNTNKAIWAQSFAKTEGDINKTQAVYLKLRVKVLKQEEEVRMEKEAQAKILILKNRNKSELMADYGISYDGSFYHFDKYTYSSLQDAVNYAEKRLSNKNA